MYWSQTESSKCSLDSLSFHPRRPFTVIRGSRSQVDASDSAHLYRRRPRNKKVRPRHTHAHKQCRDTIYAVRRVYSAGAQWLLPSPVSHWLASAFTRRFRTPPPPPPHLFPQISLLKRRRCGGAQYAPRSWREQS
eukprot:scaffold82931_cov78-Phaeocystis_antarctica.AAC.1